MRRSKLSLAEPCVPLPPSSRGQSCQPLALRMHHVYTLMGTLREASAQDVEHEDLHVQVWRQNQMMRDDPIGQLFLPLHALYATAAAPGQWYPLFTGSTEARGMSGNVGEVKLSLKMMGAEEAASAPVEALHVRVIGARHLPAADRSGGGGSSSDPFVTLEFSGKEESRVQTKTVQGSTEPVWRQRFELLLGGEADEGSLHVGVWHKNLVGADELLGRVLLPIEAIRKKVGASALDPEEVSRFFERLLKQKVGRRRLV